MNIRVIKLIATPICMVITHHFVSIPSPHVLPFLCTTIILRTFPTYFPRCLHKVMRTFCPFSFLFGVESHFTLMYVHVLLLLYFMPCINIRLFRIEPFLSCEASFNWPQELQAFIISLSLCTNTSIVLLVKIMDCTRLRYWYTELR